MNKLTFMDFFSGIGGFRIGLERAGFECVGYCDNDEYANKLYRNYFNTEKESLYNDITTINTSELPDFDIFCGGFPCQSFSIVAQNPKRLGYKDERGMLFFEMCRILREKQPKCFIAENVKGLLSANKGEAFPLIISEFEKSGYQVTHKLINAAAFGVPQKRERVIIVGIRNDLGFKYKFPDDVFVEDEYAVLGSVVENRVDEKYFFSEKAVQGMRAAKRDMNKGRAQDLNKPCNTVGSHLAKVSLNSTDPVLLDGGRYRRFTPREVARIQSFPESFKLIGVEGAQYRALGNAIPPVMFWYIAHQLCELLRENNQF
jgi:DNA (cytosine-5)-methyltransferase 1